MKSTNIKVEWPICQLKDVCCKITDGAHGSPKEQATGYPMASVKDMTRFGIELKTCKLISEGDFKQLQKQGCQPFQGDVLIAKDGNSCLDTVCVYSQKEEIVLLSSIAILRPNEKILSEYLKYYLESPLTRSLLKKGYRSGSAIPRVVLKDFYCAPVIVPPLNIQKSISTILGSLDDKIELNRQMNETLEAMARAIFQSWFVDFDPVRAKVEGRDTGLPSEVAVLFPDGFEEVDGREVPRGWEVKPLSGIIDLIGGGTPKTSVEEYWNGEIPWFSVVDTPSESDMFVIDTEKHITQAGVENSSANILPIGTTIITARGTVGKLALVGVPMAMNQSCYGIKGMRGYSDYYIHFLLKRAINELQQQTHGTVFETITRQTFDGVEIVVPPDRVAQRFDTIVHAHLEKILNNLVESRTLAQIRDALLPKLMSGEIKAGLES